MASTSTPSASDTAGASNDHNVGNDPSSQQQQATPSQPTQSSNQNLTCPQCNKSFKTVATFRQHASQIHIGTTCFWPGCSKAFNTEDDLIIHLQFHNDAAPNANDTCNWPGCGRTFLWRQRVVRHLRQHNIEARNAQS
ncbi:hypothetical protein F5Y13DRAFT_186316 [Hypoxylon sp. FL1857]|nr:hypothetical protein F5Y13DRAFT_186316 [Hypoxylon sp. FL1857]